MKTERKQSEQSWENPKTVLFSGMFHTFLILTAVSFFIRLVGVDWFTSSVEIPEPSEPIQKLIKAGLKVFELVFIYKILTKRSFFFCLIISIAQTIVTPLFGAGYVQSALDMAFWFAIPLSLRKDKGAAIVDALALYFLLTLYSALSLVGKFGELEKSQVHSFYKAVMSIADYKFFIVTLYSYINYKGGIKLWKIKRKLFQR